MMMKMMMIYEKRKDPLYYIMLGTFLSMLVYDDEDNDADNNDND